MKLGFVSAILADATFEEVIDYAKEKGYDCVELASWPKGKAERRYAGVTHFDVEMLTEEYAEYVRSYCRERGVEISALAYYPNTMSEDLEKRNLAIEHIKKLIKAAKKLNIGMVTTFAGRMTSKTVTKNLDLFEQIWKPIVELAEANDVKIAFENCPMLFTEDEWPGGQNLATTPYIWRELFKRIPSKYLGINYDPSHFVWQQIDYIKPIYEFRDKIFHVHYKDIKIYRDRLNDVGIMAPPLQYMAPKLPGFGDVDWGKYVSALTDIGYDGFTCIEIEDKAFEGSTKKIKQSLELSHRYISQFVI